MSFNRGRKKRKESGLRRIFERSVKELKTEAHNEDEEWPSLPTVSQTLHSVPDVLKQDSKKTDDMSNEVQLEEQKSVPEMAKDMKSPSEDEPKSDDLHKKCQIINENLTSSCTNLQQKDNFLTSFTQREHINFPVIEETESTSDNQSSKTLSKNSDKREREKPKGTRKSRHMLKENTERRMTSETKSSRSNQLMNERHISSMTRASEIRGPVNRGRGSDSRGKGERERLKTGDQRLNGTSKKRKESKVVRPETSRLSTTESEDDKWHHRDKQECGVVEDWMNDLLDVPNLDPTKIIIPRENVLQGGTLYEERSQRIEGKHKTIHEKSNQLESVQASGNSMDDRSNPDSCKEHISDITGGISTDVKNRNQGFDSDLHFEEEWECQEVPSVTMKFVEEDTFFSSAKTDLEFTESVLETIEEEGGTLCKEMNAQGKDKQIYDLCKTETEDDDELLGNAKDKPMFGKIDQTLQENRQGELSSQTESEDSLSVMSSKNTQGEESIFTEDRYCKNIIYMETNSIGGKISTKDQNKRCEEDCNKDSSESLASSVSSKPMVSSVEDWSSEYLDSEDHSNTYHKILQDKIAALKSRIPMKMSTSLKGQEREFGSRGKHRQRDSPFQSYLKTIHFEDGTSIDQNNNADFCTITGAELKEYVNTVQKTGGNKTGAQTGESFLAKKMEEGHHSSVCTKRSSGVENKWPSRPPGFIINLPSHSLDETEQVKLSPVALFHENIENTMETLGKCEKLHGSISKEHKGESKVEVSSLSATFHGLDLDSTFEGKKVIKDAENLDDLKNVRENWENSLYDIDTMDLHVSGKQISDVAVVPDTNVEGEFCKESVVEHCVPEEQETLDSSMESLSFPHFSNNICDSQNTLNGIPTISEYENSVKDEDLVSQFEDSLEDIGQQRPPQSVFIPNEETSSSCSKSSRKNYEHFQKAPARLEEKRSENRKKALERRKDPRNGLKCHCPADCVQFWMWRSCLCQDPYLYSIQSATNGHPAKNLISYGPYEEMRPRSNAESFTPDESGKVLEEDINSGQTLQQKENVIRSRDLSSDNTPSPYMSGELGTLRTADISNRRQGECSGLDQNNSSNGADDNESLELSDGDSSDRCSVDSPVSEEADVSECSAEGEQEDSLPYQYLASYRPVVNYMGYPPGYSFYPTYPAAYPGTQAGLGRRYPGPYPDLYEPYPPAFMSGRYSRQQCVDGQMYPDHPGYLPAMFYPQFMMVNGWREASLHHGEPHLGFIPRYIYPSSHKGHESSIGRCRRESESHGSNSRDVGHGSLGEDAGHHHNIPECHHSMKKKPKDAVGRDVSKISSTLNEESPNKNLYIPPHKRVPNMHGQSVARENRPTNNRDISPPSVFLYPGETSRTWREERSHLDGSVDKGSSEVSYWRTQQNRMLSCPTTWECNSNAQNLSRSFASMYYESHQQQDGQGRRTPTEMSQGASEDEPSGCDLFLASSSEDSTPTSRPYRFDNQNQNIDKYPDTVTLDWKSAFLERCNIYGVGYIDSHCHIDFLFNRLDFKGNWSDFKVQNMKTFPSSYLGCVAVFCNPNSFKQEGLWKSLSKEENVWLTFGCHPKNARDFTKWNLEGLRKCLGNHRVVALGEIGLDYSGVFVETKELQKSVFKKQIRMALDMRKPLVIHCREAEEDCLDILRQMVPRHYKIHCHCFTGDFTSAKLWLNHFPNLYIGLTPLVTYRTAKGARDVAKFIPLKRLLLESDAPYFVPRTIPKESMNYSHPGLCVTVAEEVARLKNISVQEVLKACLENTRDMYNI
ncbi:uncharacterized protein LOC133190547 [Saccostrea echinata]|uniref:uncharacterized protein LOC133190547 n=1 Tax=Saccostrea echinata TaxID=191078 RepID=UPI002A81E6CD|nr:uncharacterized protein LOC133190547 [Saccostrea echinata]